jgi:phosphatidate cytidylyltransferase
MRLFWIFRREKDVLEGYKGLILHRVISAIIGVPIILLAIRFGGIPLRILVLALFVIGFFEYSRLSESMNIKIRFWEGLVGGIIILLWSWEYATSVLQTLIVLWVYLMLYFIIMQDIENSLSRISATIFGLIYLAVPLSMFLIMRKFDPQGYWCAMVMIGTWAFDTTAYFVGRGFGRHRLASILSPLKSWEGFIGGLIATTIATFAFLSDYRGIVIGILLGLGVQAGDLFESLLKREARVKDSGSIIPGHGGILDRFDGFLVGIVVVFPLIRFIVGGIW